MKSIYVVTVTAAFTKEFNVQYIFYADSKKIAIQKGENIFYKYHTHSNKILNIKAERFTENWLGDKILEVI